MKKIVYILMVLTVVTAQGQSRGRSWKRGALHASEFGGVAPAVSSGNSHLEYDLTYSLTGAHEGRDTYLYCRGAALMYPRDSWLADGHDDEGELTYNQAIFDLVEIHRRHLERTAFLMKKRYQYGPLLEETLQQLRREVKMFEAATDHGRDSAVVERIRRTNRRWLNEHTGGRPEFTLSPFWWCMGMDGGIAFNTGGINRIITPSIGSTGFHAGFGWGRHGFYYRVMDVTTVARDSTYDFDGHRILPAMRRTDANLLGYGFTLVERSAFSITPYVSLGVTSMESLMDWYIGTCYTFGVMGSYHFHHWHSIKDGVRGKGRRFTPSVMANLYVSYINLDSDGRGLTFGLHLGFDFGVRREKVAWKDE